jgi:hypothetical protein
MDRRIFFNSPLKIMKFDTIDFENGVKLRENNWKKLQIFFELEEKEGRGEEKWRAGGGEGVYTW